LIAKAPTKERTEIKNKFNPEHWFLSQVETHIRTQPAGEKTPLCVDNAFLRAYAEKPTRFSLSDPRVEHVSSCDYCLHNLLNMRAAQRQTIDRRPVFLRHRLSALAVVALACLLIGFLTATVWYHRSPHPTSIQSAEVRRTLDLSEYGTYRGDQPPSNPPLHLPAALVRLELVLPRLSQPGAYYIMIAADKNGLNRVACAKANAVGADPRTVVTVSLDLRSATPGRYVLLTQLQGEDAPYTYPLQIE